MGDFVVDIAGNDGGYLTGDGVGELVGDGVVELMGYNGGYLFQR